MIKIISILISLLSDKDFKLLNNELANYNLTVSKNEILISDTREGKNYTIKILNFGIYRTYIIDLLIELYKKSYSKQEIINRFGNTTQSTYLIGYFSGEYLNNTNLINNLTRYHAVIEVEEVSSINIVSY